MSSASSAEHKRRRTAVALGISLALHTLAIIWFKALSTLPALDIEFVKPDEVAFGVTEAPTQTPEPRISVAAPAPSNPSSVAAANEKPPGESPPRPKPPPPPPPAPAVAAESGAIGQFAPQGAQIALRLDLERIQDSPLAEDVTGLLRDMPDVRALLDGSGVDPVHDLTRLFLASPDLRREHVVMAGRYRGDERVPRAAVDKLAQLRGQAANWRNLRGIRVAPWFNHDETARVLALVGPSLFAITREQDLARVLAVARALRPRAHEPEADSLVRMADRELMNVAVENARSFVRGARVEQAPLSFELSVLHRDTGVEVKLQARYPDAEQSRAAQAFLIKLRDRYAAHPLLALMGMDAMLRAVKLETHAESLVGQAEVPITQARLLLHFVRDAMQRSNPASSRSGSATEP